MVTPVPSSRPLSPVARMIQEDLQGLRDSWLWFLILGIALIVLGMAALVYSVAASIATALFFGFILVAGGICCIAGAFFTRGWGGFFLSLLSGVLELALGVILIEHPIDALIVYTLLLAVVFFIEGLFWILAALAGGFRNWGWVLLSGTVTLLLGVLIWRQWPVSALWLVGTFIGVNMIFNGVTYVALGLNVRKLPAWPGEDSPR
jgi:uncharacterized membrane protein HdeD (DUF308 family)